MIIKIPKNIIILSEEDYIKTIKELKKIEKN